MKDTLSTTEIAAVVAASCHLSDSDASLSDDSSDEHEIENKQVELPGVKSKDDDEDEDLVRQEEGRRTSRVSFNLANSVIEFDEEWDQFSYGPQQGKYGMAGSGLDASGGSGHTSRSTLSRTLSTNCVDALGNSSLSSHLRMSRNHKCIDEDILHRAAADAGVGSYGTVYVEVWALEGTELVRPEGGYWMDPIFHNAATLAGCCGSLHCSACRISDPDHPRFLPAEPVAPGVGLAGVLWNESSSVQDSALSPQRRGTATNYGTIELVKPRRFSFQRRSSEASITQQESEFAEEDPPLRPSRRQSDLSGGRRASDQTGARRGSLFSSRTSSARGSMFSATAEPMRRGSSFSAAARRSTASTRRRSFLDIAGDAIQTASDAIVDTVVGEGGGLFGDNHHQPHHSHNRRKVIWRDVQAMANNPHLPYDERLKAIADSGLGWAAGVPFHVNNHKGLVIYVARKTVDQARLRQSANEEYLLCAANLIGSAYALRTPRRRASEDHKAIRDAAFRRCKLKILTLIRLGAKFDHTPQVVEDGRPAQLKKGFESKVSSFQKAVGKVVKKCKSSNNKPPPPFSTDQACFTFMGSFCVLSLLAGIGNLLHSTYGSEYLLLMPPFGAFICLQFSLTQAPAAQPRNCLVGQLLSSGIAFAIAALPLLPGWFKQALGTSLAIGAMSRCGVTHPPAGAAAFLFASGQFGLTHVGLLLGGNIIAILLGSVINNISEKRQYPTYYAMGLNPKDMVEYLKR